MSEINAAKRVSEVFNPIEPPTYSDITRSDVVNAMAWALTDPWGQYVEVSGTTKFGKSTLVNDVVNQYCDVSFKLAGQDLSSLDDFWIQLAYLLGIPHSSSTGTTTAQKSNWGIISRLGLGNFAAITARGGESSESGTTDSNSHEISLNVAVKEALAILREASKKVAIVIDDFHFVQKSAVRREILVALRPISQMGVTPVLITLPRTSMDPAYTGTQIGGRKKEVAVPVWDVSDLEAIAWKGFQALKLTSDAGVVTRLASESFGSPQLMQQLLKQLCAFNDVYEECDSVFTLLAPESWEDFFRSVRDQEAFDWLRKLGGGPVSRRRRLRYDLAPYTDLDGYQLILLEIRGADDSKPLTMTELKESIGSKLGFTGQQVTSMNLEQKAINMSNLASREMESALDKYRAELTTEDAEDDLATTDLSDAPSIPQPVFIYRADDWPTQTLEVLDPLLSYSLRWHENSFLPRIADN